MLSSDRCLFLRSSLDRAAWPSTCRRSFSACCSLSCKSSCNVSGMRDVRSSAAVLLQDILLQRMEHQCGCWAPECISCHSHQQYCICKDGIKFFILTDLCAKVCCLKAPS